jgi:CDP-glycerol glycerophosphotransferase
MPPSLADGADRPDREVTAVFASFEKSYSDSPRAIDRELARRGAAIRRRWLLPEGAPAPAGIERIAPGTEAARRALREADYIVSNTYLLQRFEKKPGAVYLQTWHGTTLKRIGHDIDIPRFILEYEVTSEDDVRRWDWLISPNEFSNPILEQVYPGVRLLKTGYPRTDQLASPQAGELRERIRRELGLRPEQRAVLYAPTFRDDDIGLRFALEPRMLEDALDADTVVLARSHAMTPGADSDGDREGWRDVTAYPDIADLHLAADVLITDYSSSMFDFAVTGKPLLFYTYDLEHYRAHRGFCFDFENESPGPLLRTPEQVVAALGDLESVTAQYAGRYEAFRRRFCHWDDGHASERVVDAVFGPHALAAAGSAGNAGSAGSAGSAGGAGSSRPADAGDPAAAAPAGGSR